MDRFSHLTKMEIVEIPVGRRVCSLGKAHETKDADIFLHAWSSLSCAFMGPQNAGHRIQHGFGATKYFRRGIPGDVRHRGRRPKGLERANDTFGRTPGSPGRMAIRRPGPSGRRQLARLQHPASDQQGTQSCDAAAGGASRSHSRWSGSRRRCARQLASAYQYERWRFQLRSKRPDVRQTASFSRRRGARRETAGRRAPDDTRMGR